MEELLRQLLNRLQAIGEYHEELYDTEVREAMGDAVVDGFIRALPDFSLPRDFKLYSPEGNRLVKEALAAYMIQANKKAMELGLMTFHSRLAAFQNYDVKAPGQYQRTYGSFFGWMKPEDFDESGNVIRRTG